MLCSGLLMVLGLIQGQGLAHKVKNQREALVSLWVKKPQFFKLKYTSFFNVHMKI
jgi:hypothetical protein